MQSKTKKDITDKIDTILLRPLFIISQTAKHIMYSRSILELITVF